MIEIAHAQISYPNKDEDTFVVQAQGNSYLLAVADGLTMDDGKAAAKWVQRFLLNTNGIQSARGIFDAMKVALENDPYTYERSETTVTCGILSESDHLGIPILRFDFFAIGDSPIWKLVFTSDEKYPFQRYLVHGGPYPSETSMVYSTLGLKEKSIKGVVSFGSVELDAGDVLVVCSDGIPEREVMVRDLKVPIEPNLPKLCEWLLNSSPYQEVGLQNVLSGYQQRELLFDDATIIVARLVTRPIFEGVPNRLDFDEPVEMQDLQVAALLKAKPLVGSDGRGTNVPLEEGGQEPNFKTPTDAEQEGLADSGEERSSEKSELVGHFLDTTFDYDPEAVKDVSETPVDPMGAHTNDLIGNAKQENEKKLNQIATPSRVATNRKTRNGTTGQKKREKPKHKR